MKTRSVWIFVLVLTLAGPGFAHRSLLRVDTAELELHGPPRAQHAEKVPLDVVKPLTLVLRDGGLVLFEQRRWTFKGRTGALNVSEAAGLTGSVQQIGVLVTNTVGEVDATTGAVSWPDQNGLMMSITSLEGLHDLSHDNLVDMTNVVSRIKDGNSAGIAVSNGLGPCTGSIEVYISAVDGSSSLRFSATVIAEDTDDDGTFDIGCDLERFFDDRQWPWYMRRGLLGPLPPDPWVIPVVLTLAGLVLGGGVTYLVMKKKSSRAA